MKEILNETQRLYCPVCSVGPPSIKIGYISRGTCLDYIYDKVKTVDYAFAWEIYSNESVFNEMEEYVRKKKNSSFLLIENMDTRVNLRRKKAVNYSPEENNSCLKLFNPVEKTKYDFIMINWLEAILSLLNFVKQKT